MKIAHPDLEFFPTGGRAAIKGDAAFRAWMEPDAFEEQKIEPLEFRINGKKVLVRAHVWGRGAGSGIEMELDMWIVWALNDYDLVTRVAVFLPNEEAEAFEAAGLAD